MREDGYTARPKSIRARTEAEKGSHALKKMYKKLSKKTGLRAYAKKLSDAGVKAAQVWLENKHKGLHRLKSKARPKT